MDEDPRLWATYDIINLFFMIPFLALSILAFWRLPLQYAAFGFLMMMLPLSFPSSVSLMSMPRFVLVIFPLFILMALLVQGRGWLDKTITYTSLVFLGLFLSKFVVWTWVA
jgi:hypothetical protein